MPASAAGSPEAPRPLPRLVGTVVVPQQRSVALIQPLPDSRELALHEGDHLGDLTVIAIRPSEVELSGPAQDGGVQLRLTAMRRPAEPAPPVALPDPRDRRLGDQDE